MNRIILASQSPRRRDLLTKMGITYQIIPSNFDENLDDSRFPEEVAIELALGKAMTVARMHPDCIVIGSDTIVTVNGKQLEKPHDKAEARQMLKLLSGTSNEVSTGLAVIRISDGTKLVGADTTKVHFHPYNEQLVDDYVETGDSLDKAGGYGLQSGAAVLVDYMEGEYDTVLGLPTKLLASFFAQLGVEAKAVELVSPVEQRKR